MAIYVVMEPPGSQPPADGALLIRDGYSWLAFLVPPLWLLWHSLWIEALLAVVIIGLLSVVGSMTGHELAGSLLTLLVSIYVGLEGSALRVAALRRRGWREWGVAEANNLDDAYARYALDAEPDSAETAPTQRIVPDASLARPAQTGMVLGLSHQPGRP